MRQIPKYTTSLTIFSSIKSDTKTLCDKAGANQKIIYNIKEQIKKTLDIRKAAVLSPEYR